MFAPYESAWRCTGRPQHGAVALMSWVLSDYRQGAYNLGIYVCRQVRGKPMTSIHGEGRAIDVGFRLVNGRANPAGTRLVQMLLPHVGALGIQMIIWNRTVWSRKNPRGTRYNGVHPHYDHIHIELNWHAARYLTVAKIRSIMKGVAIPPQGQVTQPQPKPKPEPPKPILRRMKPMMLCKYENDPQLWFTDGTTKIKVVSEGQRQSYQWMLGRANIPTDYVILNKQKSGEFLNRIPTVTVDAYTTNAERLKLSQGIVKSLVTEIRKIFGK